MTEPSDGVYSVEEIARAWLTKMRGPDADAVREEFDVWLSSAGAHRKAYERAQHQIAASAILKTSARYGTARAAKRRGRLAGWMPAGVGVAAAALFVVVIGTGTITIPGLQPESASTARAALPLKTKHGEIRTFPLEDGSTLTLDTDSRALVTLNPDRKIELVKGRARLRVAAHDAPMHIAAGSVGLTADAAEIDIGIDRDGTVKFVLTKGAGRLATNRDPSRTTHLTPGSALAFERDGKRSASGAEIPSSWPEGWVDYRSVPLSELVAEANRYASPRLALADPELGNLEISGRFQVNRTEHLARRIGQLFDLAVDRRADGIYLRRQ
jgi:transmembrane sensor